jgi:predicted AAA+ superfamily ATPase
MKMQFEVCLFLRKQAGKKYTARELSSSLKIPAKNIRDALSRLSRSGIVNRLKTVNLNKHFEYKYQMKAR